MIILKPYQEKAVNRLLEAFYELAKMPKSRSRMVFKAPTGSGKTVTMAAMLNRLSEELPDVLPGRQFAFIWLAPNTLHLQSLGALKNFFADIRSIRPIQFEDVTDGYLKPNELLFLNWQSINKANNIYIRENETERTLYSYVKRSSIKGIEVVLLIDEEHLMAKGGKAEELLKNIHAKIEVCISATPITRSDYGHTIKRNEAIEAQMIKKSVLLNPALDAASQDDRMLDQVLLDKALEKREELVKAYQELGVNVNPLLLIQLPSDTASESALDRQKIEVVEKWLEHKGITTQNNKLAVWLSNRKVNLEGLEAPSCMTEVLLFKQAIALGWDCPRAAVLLIFREINNARFGVQTVGRILRMPEQRHYPNALLNQGYVYTNLTSREVIIEAEDMDYMTKHIAKRKNEYQEVGLTAIHVNTRLDRNRLGSKFRVSLARTAERVWGLHKRGMATQYWAENQQTLIQRMMLLDVSRIEIAVIANEEIGGDAGVYATEKQERFARTMGELEQQFKQFCRAHVGGYAKVDSTPMLGMALICLMEEYLGIDEMSSIKIILHGQNQEHFKALIDQALEDYRQMMAQEAMKKEQKAAYAIWEVPAERSYPSDTYTSQTVQGHVMEPYFQFLRASEPEKAFEGFLERHSAHITWWYKNGDSGQEHFCIAYTNHKGVMANFFVDYVLKLKDGTLALFDTKTLDSDPDMVAKHNALIEYLQEQREKGKRKMIGGVIVPKGVTPYIWKYSQHRIENNYEDAGWSVFEPSKFQ